MLIYSYYWFNSYSSGKVRLGRRSPRNTSSLASPTDASALLLALSAMSSMSKGTVLNWRRQDWGMVKKIKSSPELDEVFWVTDDIANFW